MMSLPVVVTFSVAKVVPLTVSLATSVAVWCFGSWSTTFVWRGSRFRTEKLLLFAPMTVICVTSPAAGADVRRTVARTRWLDHDSVAETFSKTVESAVSDATDGLSVRQPENDKPQTKKTAT